jgi:Na+/H+ antiporter NhaC
MSATTSALATVVAAVMQFVSKNAVKYGPLVAAIATGAALIATKNYGEGVQTILQALLVASGGTAAVQVAAAVHSVPKRVLDAAKYHE